ncbi:MAG TPA: DUF4157 domain-containing protein [Dehalococcoidia bacterium]|nr:DUF4157 domain-containing protein [Dehalococcoidia bacterium]
MRIDGETAAKLAPWFPGLNLGRVRLVTRGPVCWFVRKVLRQGAMTFAPFVFFGSHAFNPLDEGSLALLAHELKHVEQYGRYGYVGFLARYFWALARNQFRYSAELPLEAEAYALQARVRSGLGGAHL